MSKRKILLVAMSICMIAILAIGGSLAFFTDDEQITNTMVIGNVEINIDEFTYTNGTWAPFEDDTFVLYPIDNDQGIKLYNKMVYTANTSSSKHDVYIRNIVLIEANALVTAANETDCCFPGVHYGYHNATAPTTSAADGKVYYGSKIAQSISEPVTVDGKDYYVVVFVEAQERAIPYDACLNTLHSVWMDENVTQEQAKGWGEENKVEIVVFSQGIQATGLTHEQAMAELGEVNEANLNAWIDADDAVINDWSDK